MDIKTRKIPRPDLSATFKDHKTLVAFEQLQADATSSGDVLNAAGFILTAPNINLAASRVLTGSANVSVDDGDPNVILDLTDTTVTPDTYGSITRVIILVVDEKGRLTAASEVQFDISDVTGNLAVAHGGTHLTAYTVGDFIYADGAASLARLANVAIGNVLLSGGVGVASAWGKVGLTTHVSGILPEANGGTGTATAGFSGTGAYTNFTFVNGKCTAAS